MIPSVNFIQMVVAISRVIVKGHIASRTLEAHTGIASTTLNFEASCISHHQGFTFFSRTFSYALLFHVFF